LNRAGKRTRRPEQVVCAAAGLGWGAGRDVCFGGALGSERMTDVL